MSVHCPFCTEKIEETAVECNHCGEFLQGEEAPKRSRKQTALLVIVVGGVLSALCLCFPLIALMTMPMVGAQRTANETSAVATLMTLNGAQAVYRESDKDGNGVLDYGNLENLSACQLIDAELASGTRRGYVYQVRVSPDKPMLRWMAVASPSIPQGTGYRYFATNHEGALYYSVNAPIPLNDACEIPATRPDVHRLGQ